MVYLADWRSAITRGKQITDIVWEFNYYGPYVDDIVNLNQRPGENYMLYAANHVGFICASV
jgi:hypothetical protein